MLLCCYQASCHSINSEYHFGVPTINFHGCFASATVEVSTCTGIKNVSAATFSTIVYPNLSNGDFMIASDRTDVIVITNELGQNIQTIQLNQSNNFSSKVSNLSVGIYFVTGTTIKQKIVVTK